MPLRSSDSRFVRKPDRWVGKRERRKRAKGDESETNAEHRDGKDTLFAVRDVGVDGEAEEDHGIYHSFFHSHLHTQICIYILLLPCI